MGNVPPTGGLIAKTPQCAVIELLCRVIQAVTRDRSIIPAYSACCACEIFVDLCAEQKRLRLEREIAEVEAWVLTLLVEA